MRPFNLLFALVFFGCGSQDLGSPGPIVFSQIGKGALHGNGAEGIEESRLVISDPQAWEALLAKMDSVNKESGGLDLADLDFTTHQVLAVFDQVRGSGGHAVAITGISEQDGTLLVAVKSTAAQGPNIQVMNQPFHIVSIPKTDRPILFQ